MKKRKANRKNRFPLDFALMGIVFFLLTAGLVSFLDKNFSKSNDKKIETEIYDGKKEIRRVAIYANPDKEGWFYWKAEEGDTVELLARTLALHEYQLVQWNNLERSDNNIHFGKGQIIKYKDVSFKSYYCRASWYGSKFHGKTMANGEVYNMYTKLIAHRHLPFNRPVKIHYQGKEFIAVVEDRGPFSRGKDGEYDRDVDLSYALAKEMGSIEAGVVSIKLEPLKMNPQIVEL